MIVVRRRYRSSINLKKTLVCSGLEILGPDEAAATAALDRLEQEGRGQPGLAHPGRADENEVLRLRDEFQLGEVAHLLVRDARLLFEGKRLQCPLLRELRAGDAHDRAFSWAWCDKVNATTKRHLHASPRELFAVERTRMKALPPQVPEVYELHHRIVDTEGYVNVRRNRYSVPYGLMGRSVEVRESKERIEVFEGPRRVAEHKRVLESLDARVTVQEHRPPRNEGPSARHAESVEQKRLVERMPESAGYVARLRERGRGTTRDLRWLLRMIDDYPRRPMREALIEALHYGMTDLDRLERMVLRRIARDFFPKDDDDDR
jgi:hypothetical protein